MRRVALESLCYDNFSALEITYLFANANLSVCVRDKSYCLRVERQSGTHLLQKK